MSFLQVQDMCQNCFCFCSLGSLGAYRTASWIQRDRFAAGKQRGERGDEGRLRESGNGTGEEGGEGWGERGEQVAMQLS